MLFLEIRSFILQMQLCKKGTLKDWMNENNNSRDKIQILDIYDQILSAVQYVHEQGLMHRDLKVSHSHSLPECLSISEVHLHYFFIRSRLTFSSQWMAWWRSATLGWSLQWRKIRWIFLIRLCRRRTSNKTTRIKLEPNSTWVRSRFVVTCRTF